MILDVGGTIPFETELRPLMLAFAQAVMGGVTGVSSATGGQGIYVNPNTGAVVIVLDGSVNENVVASAGSTQTLPQNRNVDRCRHHHTLLGDEDGGR